MNTPLLQGMLQEGGHYGRWACMVEGQYPCRDVISGRVDLHMTESKIF